MPASNTLFLIFVIFFVISVLIEIGVLLGLLLAALKIARKVKEVLDLAKSKTTPIAGEVQSLVQDLTPKIRTISSHLVEISTTLRDQTQHVNSTVGDVVDKTRAQASKVDEMVSAVLGGISHAGSTVSSGVAKPVRKVSSILHGLRVGLDTLFESRPVSPTSRTGAVPTQAVVDQTIHPPPTTPSPL